MGAGGLVGLRLRRPELLPDGVQRPGLLRGRPADPPALNGAYVRAEQEQADYLTDLPDIYGAHGVQGAYVYEFATSDPYSPGPAGDLDMDSLGLPKSVDVGREQKESFRAPARRFGAG